MDEEHSGHFATILSFFKLFSCWASTSLIYSASISSMVISGGNPTLKSSSLNKYGYRIYPCILPVYTTYRDSNGNFTVVKASGSWTP